MIYDAHNQASYKLYLLFILCGLGLHDLLLFFQQYDLKLVHKFKTVNCDG